MVVKKKKTEEVKQEAKILNEGEIPQDLVTVTAVNTETGMEITKIESAAEEKTEKFNVLKALVDGHKVKLPEWTGYCFKKNDELWVHAANGMEFVMHESWLEKNRTDWEVVE